VTTVHDDRKTSPVTLVIGVYSHSRDPQRSPTVRDVQRALQARGYYLGPPGVDGNFGALTERAVVRFQTHWGLVADGEVGPITWSKLSKPIPTPTSTTPADNMTNLALARVTGTDGYPRMRYVYGYEIALASTVHPAYAECSELVQWAVYRTTLWATGHGDAWVDGAANQYAACQHISVDEAARTKGALLFVASDPSNPWSIHHVTVSKGDATHAEARSSAEPHMVLRSSTQAAICAAWTYAYR
jgi:hypothetical protein